MVKVLKAAVVVGGAVVLGYVLSPGLATKFGKVEEASSRKTLALELPALQGGQWSLAQERGNVVLVNFWATWCPPCRMETPGLVNISKRYAARGLKVVGVAMDEDPAREVPPFVSHFGVPYPILLPGENSTLASSIESLPTSLLIDRDGRIARTYLGAVDEQTLAHDIDQLLSERS